MKIEYDHAETNIKCWRGEDSQRCCFRGWTYVYGQSGGIQIAGKTDRILQPTSTTPAQPYRSSLEPWQYLNHGWVPTVTSGCKKMQN